MRAADLDDGAKQHLLGLMRDQLGESQYAKLRLTHGEDKIIDMMLAAAEQQHAAVTAATADARENDHVGFFWVFWIVLSLIVGAFTDATSGVMWFCSPWWFFMISGGAVIPHRRWWGAWIVAILLAFGFYSAVTSTGHQLDDKESGWYLIGGGLAAFVLSWIAGFIAARRT